jgi:hypothetical protein
VPSRSTASGIAVFSVLASIFRQPCIVPHAPVPGAVDGTMPGSDYGKLNPDGFGRGLRAGFGDQD